MSALTQLRPGHRQFAEVLVTTGDWAAAMKAGGFAKGRPLVEDLNDSTSLLYRYCEELKAHRELALKFYTPETSQLEILRVLLSEDTPKQTKIQAAQLLLAEGQTLQGIDPEEIKALFDAPCPHCGKRRHEGVYGQPESSVSS